MGKTNFYVLLDRKKNHKFNPEGTYVQVLEKFRLDNDLTKGQLASLLGVSNPTYTKLISYGSKPTAEVIANAVRLGMNVDAFLYRR